MGVAKLHAVPQVRPCACGTRPTGQLHAVDGGQIVRACVTDAASCLQDEMRWLSVLLSLARVSARDYMLLRVVSQMSGLVLHPSHKAAPVAIWPTHLVPQAPMVATACNDDTIMQLSLVNCI